MNDLVVIRDNRPATDSRTVAEVFEKRHGDVLRAIDKRIKERPDLERNFAFKVYSVETGDGAIRQARYCQMDEKGLMLLIMRFTGPKAADCQIRFVDAFEAMRAILAAPAKPVLDYAMQKDQILTLNEIFGQHEARVAARAHGWPVSRRARALPAPRRNDVVIDRMIQAGHELAESRENFTQDQAATRANVVPHALTPGTWIEIEATWATMKIVPIYKSQGNGILKFYRRQIA